MATIKIKKIEPKVVNEEETIERVPNTRGPLEESVEVRDLISGLIGKGYTDLTNDDAKKNFSRLQVVLGRPKANEVLQKIIIHNQDPRYKARPIEERITSFYDQQREDPIIGKARSLGYGVVPGFRASPNVLLQSLQGNIPVAENTVEPSFSKKVALKINK